MTHGLIDVFGLQKG